MTPLNNEPDNKADLYIDFNGGANTSVAAGFRFDKAPVEAEYTKFIRNKIGDSQEIKESEQWRIPKGI